MTEIQPVLQGEIVPESLDDLAAAANDAHRACESAMGSALEHAIRCGEYLTEAKSQVSHGEWLPWLERNFQSTRRQASTYMRIAANGKRASHLDSIRAALREIAPEESGKIEQQKEDRDVEEKDPNAIKRIVRAGAMEYVVEFNDGNRHTIIRSVLMEQGFKKCSCCEGFGVVERHHKQSQED